MPRLIKSKLDSRTARNSIAHGTKTHWQTISRGRAIGYRKGLKVRTWYARFDAGIRREKRLGEADDNQDADGVQILDFALALKEAEKFFAEMLGEVSGETIRRGPYKVADAIEDYVKKLKDDGKPDYPGAVYDFDRNVIPQLGDIDLAKLTAARIRSWRSKLAERRKLSTKKLQKDAPSDPPKEMTEEEQRKRRSTVNRTVRRLKAAFNFAVESGNTHAKPSNWSIAPFENADAARIEYLTEEEQRTFVGACSLEPDFQNLVVVALHSGCRLGELARMRVQDFDASSKSLYVVKSKSGKPRHVLLDDDGAIFCKRLIANRKRDEFLLPRKDGSAWKKDAVKKPMTRACARAQIKRLGFHQLRHSFATRLLTQRVLLPVVSAQLGHQDGRMAQKNYGHITDKHRRDAMDSLPSVGLNEAARAKPATVIALPSRERTA
jgi:integrase